MLFRSIAVVIVRSVRFGAPVPVMRAAPEQETPEAREDTPFGISGGSVRHVAHDRLRQLGSGRAFMKRAGSRRLAHHSGLAVPLGGGNRSIETALARMGRTIETGASDFFVV